MQDIDILPDTILNERYKLIALLGKGGSGVVYKAADLQTDQIVAIKILLEQEYENKEERTKKHRFFQREVALLKLVSHPHIVQVLDSGISEANYRYLVMEYCEGRSLKAILKSGQMTLAHTAYILPQIGQALAAIHAQGIIHRDFKPQNVIVNNVGEHAIAKLLDFGIAKMIRGNKEEVYLKTLTAQGVIAGTVQYMSPEQCQNHKLAETTDVYSMGITAYEMVSGRLPFDHKSPISLILMHIETAPPSIRGIPRNLQAVIFKALAKNPQDRYPTTTSFAEAFAKEVAQMGPSAHSFVIHGDGAGANEETEYIESQQDSSTLMIDSNETNNVSLKQTLWTSIRRKLKF